jgi:hypothetical protein
VPSLGSWARRVIREGCETTASAVSVDCREASGMQESSIRRVFRGMCVVNEEKQRGR